MVGVDNKISSVILRNVYADLTKTEKRIADYIMINMDTIMEQTISDIAAGINTSEITVSRFCKKIGYSGLQSLKIALASEMQSANEPVFCDVSKDDSNEDVARKVFQNINDGMSDTLKLLDFSAIEQAVNRLVEAKKIAVYGFGNSATVCRDIETRFLRFGIPVQAFSDAHQQITSAALMQDGDVVIAVSHTGATLELLESVELAKQNGATIIAITSYAKSPLVKLADITLQGMGREVHYCSEAIASRLVHMAITDILYTAISMRIPEHYKMNINRMRRAIARKRV